MLQQRAEQDVPTLSWARQKLFRRLSMNSALIEAQSNEYLLGGSNGFMTARDWLRIGLLYARDGVWVDGTRIFPEGWVDYTKSPSPANSGYGKHVWLDTISGYRYYCFVGFRYGGRGWSRTGGRAGRVGRGRAGEGAGGRPGGGARGERG